MAIPKTIDITKIQPFNWKYLLMIVAVVVIVGSIVAVGMWVKDQVASRMPIAGTQEQII